MKSEIKVKSLEAIRLEETIDMVVVYNETPYRLRVLVSDSPKRKFVKDISFRDKHKIDIDPLTEKRIKYFIINYFREN